MIDVVSTVLIVVLLDDTVRIDAPLFRRTVVPVEPDDANSEGAPL